MALRATSALYSCGRLNEPEINPVGVNERAGKVSKLLARLQLGKIRVVLQMLGKIRGFQKSDCSQSRVTTDFCPRR